jgi:hypothetical protein
MKSVAVIGPAATARDSDVAPQPRWARWARRAAAAAVPVCYLLAAVLLTWRLWGNPASRMVGGNPHDADQFAWFMRYAATAVSHGRLPALVTTGLNAPTGVNLMWNTSLLLPGVVLAPVTLMAGPQVSLTILTTAGFAGSATALYWVLRRWDVSISAAALAGAVYGFSPALLQSALGHYDLELAILPPLIVGAGVRLTVGPAVRRSRSARPPVRWPARWLARVPAWVRTGAWLGLLVAAQIFIDEELALTTALTTVLVVLVLAVSRPRTAIRRVIPTAAGLIVAAAVAVALAGSALWTQFHGPLVEHGAPYPPDRYVNDLTTFVTPQGALFFHTAASAAAAASFQGGAPEYLGYLGWPLIVALAVAAVVTWRRPAGRVAAVTFVVLCVCSMGGHPLIAGTSYPAVDLPWHWVEAYPIFNAALPDRLSILADGAAAALLAVGIDAVRARLKAGWPFWRWAAARLTQQRPFWRRAATRLTQQLSFLRWPARLTERRPFLGWPARLAERRPFWRRPARLTEQQKFWRQPSRLAEQRKLLQRPAPLPTQQKFWQRPARLAAQLAVLMVAVACCLPLLPRQLSDASTAPLPAGWSAIFTSLNIGPDTRVLVLPVPRHNLTLAMRWSAESGDPSEMIGGYFIGPHGAGTAVGLTSRRMPAYLNYLWAQSVPPGGPYSGAASTAYNQWAGAIRRTLTPRAPIQPVVHVAAALTGLASWRPQAVVADATATSPLGLYLTRLLGPPTVSVDDVIGWQLTGISWPTLSAGLFHTDASRSCAGTGKPGAGCKTATQHAVARRPATKR